MGNTNDIREEFTYLEINGEDYRVGNINPMMGVYIGAKLINIIAPLLTSFMSKNKDVLSESDSTDDIKISDINFDDLDIQGSLSKLDKKDFVDIQTECLKVCERHTKTGWLPVVNLNGSMAYNLRIKEVVKLVVECIKFNLSDFFDGESLL